MMTLAYLERISEYRKDLTHGDPSKTMLLLAKLRQGLR